MLAAFINGSIGLTLSIIIGVRMFDWSLPDTLFCVLIANCSALLSVLSTLQLEKLPWVVKRKLNRSWTTWSVLSFLYLGILLTFVPDLRSPREFVYLFLPLLLSTGFSIMVFGPIQDFLVRRQQIKAKMRS